MPKERGYKVTDMLNGEVTKFEYEGAEYVALEGRGADVGDYVVFTDLNIRYLTLNKPYAVTDIDLDGDLYFLDNDGDKNCAEFGEDDFSVYEKVAPPHKKPRKAQVGDKVKMVAIEPNYGLGSIKVGDVGIVTTIHDSGIYLIDFDAQSNWSGRSSELEVITEPETITHEGREYTLVDRKAQAGDVVYVTKEAESTAAIPVGTFYVVDDRLEITNSGSLGSFGVYRERYDRTEDTVKVYAPSADSLTPPAPLLARLIYRDADGATHEVIGAELIAYSTTKEDV